MDLSKESDNLEKMAIAVESLEDSLADSIKDITDLLTLTVQKELGSITKELQNFTKLQKMQMGIIDEQELNNKIKDMTDYINNLKK